MFYFIDHNKSLTSTSSAFAMATKVSKLGCIVLAHHLETVAGSFSTCSDNHLLVRFFSARSTLRRFMALQIYLFLFINRFVSCNSFCKMRILSANCS